MKKAFYAFSSKSTQVTDQIQRSVSSEALKVAGLQVESWMNNSIEGRLLIGPILEKIDSCDVLIADLSHQNHNVYFEIGYAMGKGKDLFFTRSSSYSTDPDELKKVGLFDSTGYKVYNNSNSLISSLETIPSREVKKFSPTSNEKNVSQPCYLLLPHDQNEAEVHICNRLKNIAKIHYRKFDPNESARFSIQDAIDQTAISFGVVLPFNSRPGFENRLHNLRCSFVAGLAEGMGIETLLVTEGDADLALDYRHRGHPFKVPTQLNKPLTDFGVSLVEAIQMKSNSGLKPLSGALAKLNFGASQAENEEVELSNYYHRTELFERLLRNEVNVIAGRKGTGKSAMFIQAGLRLSRDRWNVVVSLQPEGYQLKKLKETLLGKLEEGSRDHLLAAFWEYVFFIEIASVISRNEQGRHENDPNLAKLHAELSYFSGGNGLEMGDFAERMMQLIERLIGGCSQIETEFLQRSDIVNVLYEGDIGELKKLIGQYLNNERGVWLLVDNLDKGWYSQGVDDLDIAMLRSLLDAAQRVKRDLRSYGTVGSVVFVRNDVFEIANEHISDKGKIPKDVIDWSDDNVLRSVIRNRIAYSQGLDGRSFTELWNNICISHFASKDGAESSDYFISRSLKRPRALLDFIQKVKSHAVNAEKDRIDDEDLDAGEYNYSMQLTEDINDEMSDIYGIRRDFLYSFISCDVLISLDECKALIENSGVAPSETTKYVDILVWYGFLGIYVKEVENYIYDLAYSMRKFKGLMTRGNIFFKINPAFHRALELKI
jgi:hypothetical protein